MKRKSLALLLALSMVFGSSANVFAANYESNISIEEADVKPLESLNNSEEENALPIELPSLNYMEVEQEMPLENPDLSLLASYDSISDYTASKYITEKLPALRSQSPYGTCWAHTTIALAEISMLKKGLVDSDVDYSELHLAYYSYNSVVDPLGGTEGDHNGMTDQGLNASDIADKFMERGGNLAYSENIIASWMGAADEADVPYENAQSVIDYGLDESYAFNDAAHLINYFNAVMPNYRNSDGTINDSFADNMQAVKKLIVDYGAIGISYNANQSYMDSQNNSISCYNDDNNAFYHPDLSGTNHAVTVVGWDDDFAASSFNVAPPGNGAWLVRNSWFKQEYASYGMSEDSYYGYFWLSYYDGSLSNQAFAFEFDTEDNYAHNYQYDGAMQSYGYSSADKVANVFTAKASESEMLKAVAFATGSTNVNYTIEIYTDLTDDSDPTSGALAATQTGSVVYEGFYTIPLNNAVGLSKGSKFSVVVTLKDTEGNNARYVSESGMNSWVDITAAANAGESFIYRDYSYYDEKDKWDDFGKRTGRNIRIKAYTDDAQSVVPESISFENSSYDLQAGETIKPVVKVGPSNATNKKYTLTSSDPNVVEVINGVKLKGIKAGTATITAKTEEGNLTATAEVVVLPELVIDGDTYLYIGQSATYSVNARNSEEKIGYPVTFSSSDTSILTIDPQTGVAKAVRRGDVDIIARVRSITVELNVWCSMGRPDVTSKVSDDNTIILTWKEVPAAEYYSVEIADEEYSFTELATGIRPDSDGNCTFKDTTYTGKDLENNLYLTYRVFARCDSDYNYEYVYVNLDKRYKITYVLNGGTNSPSNPSTYYYYQSIYLAAPTPPQGMTFEGWYSDPEFTTRVYYAYGGNITVYAKYNSDSHRHSITYVLDGGVNNLLNPDSYEEGDVITFKDPTYPSDDYKFAGWYKDALFTTPVTGIKADDTEDITVYAKFVPKYTVSFHSNGGKGSMADMVLYGDEEKALIANSFTREGFTFTGWNTEPDSSGTGYLNKALIKNPNAWAGAVTLYAIWSKENVPVDKISFSVTETTLYANNTSANYFYAGAYLTITGKDGKEPTDKTVVWSSSNTDVATVDEEGNITAVSSCGEPLATAVITAATPDGSKKATFKVNVKNEIEELRILDRAETPKLYGSSALNPSTKLYGDEGPELEIGTLSLSVGKTFALKADILPKSKKSDGTFGEGIANRTVNWESSDNSVCSVSEEGVVTALSSGWTMIYAQSEEGGLRASLYVSVGLDYDEIEVNGAGNQSFIPAGKTLQLSASFAKDGNTVVPVNNEVIWEVVDGNEVAYVSENGLLTAVKEGYATVRATSAADANIYGDYQASVYVPMAKATISDKTITLAPGKIFTPKITITPSVYGANEKDTVTGDTIGSDVSEQIIWSLKNPEDSEYVDVNENTGEITAYEITKNPVIVIATIVPFNASNATILACSVTVKSTPLTKLTLSSSSIKMNAGQDNTVLLSAKLTPSVPEEDGIDWSVDSYGDCISFEEYDNGHNIYITAHKATPKGKKIKLTATTQGVNAKGKHLTASCYITVGNEAGVITISRGKDRIDDDVYADDEKRMLYTGKSMTLKSRVYTDEDTKVLSGNQKVIYSSSDTSVATVSSTGKVTAVGNGTTEITARSADNASVQATVTIDVLTVIKTLSLDKKKVKLSLKESVEDGKYEVIKPIISPNTVSDSKAVITWTVNNPGKVRLGKVPADDTGNAEFKASSVTTIVTRKGEALAIMAIAPGAVKITATEPGKKKVVCNVTINTFVNELELKPAKNLEKISDGQYKAELAKKKSFTIKPMVGLYGAPYSDSRKTPAEKAATTLYNTTKKYVTSLAVNYSSSNPSVVKVNSSGKVTAKGPGTATVTVTTRDGNITNTITVTVK